MNNVFDEVKHDIQSYERKPLSSKEIKVPCLGSNFFLSQGEIPGSWCVTKAGTCYRARCPRGATPYWRRRVR